MIQIFNKTILLVAITTFFIFSASGVFAESRDGEVAVEYGQAVTVESSTVEHSDYPDADADDYGSSVDTISQDDPIIDALDVDDDNDGIPAQGVSSSTSIEATASTQSSTRDAEYDNEDNNQDENVSPRAQSHNSSRSNRTEGIAVDDADADSSIYCWGRGACVVSQENNIDDESSRGQLRINAREVRSWSEAEASTFDGEINDEEVSSPRRAIMQYAIMQSQQDDRIQEMRINEGTLEMDYQARIRLFGFIPLKKNITGRIDAQGDTSITYPWYRFISGAPDTMRIRGLLTEGRGLLNI